MNIVVFKSETHLIESWQQVSQEPFDFEQRGQLSLHAHVEIEKLQKDLYEAELHILPIISQHQIIALLRVARFMHCLPPFA